MIMAAETAVATIEKRPPAGWKAVLDRGMEAGIIDALPKHVTPEKFRQVAARAIGSTPSLKQCMDSNPGAVLTALAQCAADGLLPDNKQAALVPFKSGDRMNLTYIPMIAGVLLRMRNSGQVDSVVARVVYEKDEFRVVYGDEEKIVHEPFIDGDAGKPRAAYAIIRLTTGETYREVMTQQQIMAVKNASRAKGGPWSGPFETEMWRKTVLKRAAKYCPFNDEIVTMLDRDNDYYDPDRVIEADPAPNVRDRFRAARIAQDAQDASPLSDAGDDDEGAVDASSGEYERVSEDAHDPAPDAMDSASDADAFPGDLPPPTSDASRATSKKADPAEVRSLVSKAIVGIAAKIEDAGSADEADALFKAFTESDAAQSCTDAEFAYVEAARDERVKSGESA